MKVIKEGHLYEVESMEGTNSQTIQFIEKEKQGDKFVTVNDGTTNEELMEVLINRLETLNEKFNSPYNISSIQHLKSALAHQHARTNDRKKRGVEGKPQK